MAILHLHAASFSWPRNGRSILLSEVCVCAPEHQGSAELPRTPFWRSSHSGHSRKYVVTRYEGLPFCPSSCGFFSFELLFVLLAVGHCDAVECSEKAS